MEAPQPDVDPQSLQIQPDVDPQSLQTLPDVDLQSLQTPVKKGGKSGKKQKTAIQTPITRCTRSRAESDWNLKEMLILVREITSVEEDCLKALSTYQKWSIISTNCIALDVERSANQCRRKWDSMVVDYKKIQVWETHSPIGSYWSLSDEQKKEYALPVLFDEELFGLIYDLLNILEVRSDSELESETEGIIAATEIGGSKKRQKLLKGKVGKEQDIIGQTETEGVTDTAVTETRDIVLYSVTETHNIVSNSESKKKKTRPKPSKKKVEKEQDNIRKSETEGLVGIAETEARDIMVYSESKKLKTQSKSSKKKVEKEQDNIRKSEIEDLVGIGETEARDIMVHSESKKEKTQPKPSETKVDKEQDNIRNSETEGLVGTAETDARDIMAGSKKSKTRRKPSKEKGEKEQALVRELRQNSQSIHAILRKNLLQNVNGSSMDLEKIGNIQTNIKRWQGDELIKVLGGLINTLNNFASLVQERS